MSDDRLTALSEGIAKKMLAETDREIKQLRDTNKKLTLENEQLKKEIEQFKQVTSQLMAQIEKESKEK